MLKMKIELLKLFPKFVFLLTLLTSSILASSPVLPFDEENPTTQLQTMPNNGIGIGIGAEEETDFIDVQIDKKIKDIPRFMRSIFYHDLCGIISATTTSFVPKLLVGTSAIYLAYESENPIPKAFGYITGLYSLGSSFIDLFTAGYCAKFSKKEFKDIIHEVIDYRSTITAKEISIDNIDNFLDYAIGEYIDMYQKRGIFNEKRFISLLKRY